MGRVGRGASQTGEMAKKEGYDVTMGVTQDGKRSGPCNSVGRVWEWRVGVGLVLVRKAVVGMTGWAREKLSQA